MKFLGFRIAAVHLMLLAFSVCAHGQDARLLSVQAGANRSNTGGNACSKDVQVRDVRCYPGADAFVQIQNCLNALPDTGGTCDATSIQGPQAVANVLSITRPATILFGDAVYTYGGSSVLIRINARGVQLIGKGRGYDSGATFGGRTQFVLTSGHGARHLVSTDADNLTIQDISFIGPGINASSGGGISNTLGHNRNIEGVIYRNVEVSDVTNAAISIKTPVSVLFENVLARKGASDGIVFFGGGTTVTCIQCFAVTMGGRGIAFDDITSVHVSGGAVESSGIGWDISDSNNVVLDATDAEVQVDRSDANPGQVGHAYRINGSTHVTLISPNSRSVPSRNSRHFVISGGSNSVRIISPRIIEGRHTPAFDIETEAGSTGIKLDGIDPAYTVSDNATGTIIEDSTGKITASALNVTGSLQINGIGVPVSQQSIFTGVYGGGASSGSLGTVSEIVLAKSITIKRLDFTIAVGGQTAPDCTAQPTVSIYDQSDATHLDVPGKQIVGPLKLAPGAHAGTSGNVDVTLPGGHIFQLVYSSGTGCSSQPSQVNIAAYYVTN
jgi:hypothetical protein